MQFDIRSHLWSTWAGLLGRCLRALHHVHLVNRDHLRPYWKLKKATDQSRKYAADVARLLKAGKFKEAVDLSAGAEREVLPPRQGLSPVSRNGSSREPARETRQGRGASKRPSAPCSGRPRSTSPISRRVSPSSPPRRHRALRGPLRNDLRHHQRLLGHGHDRLGRYRARSPPVSPKRSSPPRSASSSPSPAVWAYNYFTGQVDGFTVEMDNSGSELLDIREEDRLDRRRGAPGPAAPRGATPGGPIRTLRELQRSCNTMSMAVGDKKGGGDRGHQRDPHGRHHDRAADHLHGDHAHDAEGRRREAAQGGEHQRAQGRAQQHHRGFTKRFHASPERLRLENLAELAGRQGRRSGSQELPEGTKVAYLKADVGSSTVKS